MPSSSWQLEPPRPRPACKHDAHVQQSMTQQSLQHTTGFVDIVVPRYRSLATMPLITITRRVRSARVRAFHWRACATLLFQKTFAARGGAATLFFCALCGPRRPRRARSSCDSCKAPQRRAINHGEYIRRDGLGGGDGGGGGGGHVECAAAERRSTHRERLRVDGSVSCRSTRARQCLRAVHSHAGVARCAVVWRGGDD